MTNLSMIQTKKSGFTIVELVVVIAVIGILALIVLVAYPGYQTRNRDDVRKNDVQQVAAALSAYAIQKNSYIEPGEGCGSSKAALSGSGNGWIVANTTDLSDYMATSIVECLKNAKVLSSSSDFVDPSGCRWDSGGSCGSGSLGVPAKAYMKATCSKNGVKVTYIMARLETKPSDNSTIDNLCDTGTLPGFSGVNEDWGTRYGMNHYVTVK